MIRKAVMSYFNPDESFGNRCGFTKFSDFLFATALSAHCASRHFKEVQFVSSDWGIDVIKPLGLPFTSYSNKLNEMKGVSKYFWAYGKLLAYEMQDEPFVHIHNDVFMWNPLPKRILEANLCFQSHEPFYLEGYKYYDMLKPCFNEAPVRPQVVVDNEVTDFAYNCGICGGHNIKFFKKWIKLSAEYIFAPENQHLFFKKHANVLIHQNLFHEQYFAASLIKKMRLKKSVEVLASDIMQYERNAVTGWPQYTHLWGNTKMDIQTMSKVRMSVLSANKSLYNRIARFSQTNGIDWNWTPPEWRKQMSEDECRELYKSLTNKL